MSVQLRTKALKSGKKSYYLDIYHNGERSYEFLKIYSSPKDSATDNKEKKILAENIRAKRELEINNEDYGFVPSHRKKVDFLKYFQKFIDTNKKVGNRKFIGAFQKFKAYYQKDKLPFKNLNKKLCQGFCDYLKSKEGGLSGETPFDYFKRFQTVINKAIDEEIILKNPSKGIKISRESNQLKKEVLSKEELQTLANTYCGNEEVKRTFLFACFSGLGEAEIRQLTWERIQNNRIKLFREKNGKQIINQLPPVAIKLLGKRGATKAKIFSLPTDTAINKNLKLWLRKANIDKKITFYCGRHTFATQLLLNGANLKTVADCLGHSSTQHTVKYLNYVNELKDEAINNLPHIDF